MSYPVLTALAVALCLSGVASTVVLLCACVVAKRGEVPHPSQWE